MGFRLYKYQKKLAQQKSLFLAFSRLVLIVKWKLQTSEMLTFIITILLDTLTRLTQSIIFNNARRLISRNFSKAIVLSSSDTLRYTGCPYFLFTKLPILSFWYWYVGTFLIFCYLTEIEIMNYVQLWDRCTSIITDFDENWNYNYVINVHLRAQTSL